MSTRIQSVRELATRVARDPELAEELKEDPAGTLSRIAEPIPNTTVYRIVVAALGLAVLIALIGSIILVLKDKTNLEVLTALGSAAVGALAGLLAPSPTNS